MKKKTKIISIFIFLVLLLLAWAPWMDSGSVRNRVFEERAIIDGTVGKETGRAICDYNVIWLPFGRYVASCEGGYFVTFFGKAL